MEKIKITTHQLFTLTATISLGGSILVSSSAIATVAKQDAWMSAIISIGYGIPVMLLYFYLGSRYPGMTLIGILNKIFGKWLGAAASVAYVMLFVIISMHIPWYIGSFFGRFMRDTPSYVIEILFVAGIVIAALYGIEVIARASEIIVVLVSLFFALFIVLTLKDIKTEYLTPVLENGLYPVFKGSLLLSPYITYSIINVLMIFPRFISDMPQARNAIIKGFLWSGSISFVTILMTILVLGYALAERLSLPALHLAMNISIGAVLARLEYILSMIWLATQFMVAVAFFFSGLTGLSELIGLKDHKKIILPYGIIMLVMSGVVLPNSVYQGNWVTIVYTPLITTFGIFIPLLLIIVDIIKEKLISAAS